MKRLEAAELLSEIFVKVHAELAGDFILDHDRMAKQPADDRSAQAVFFRKVIAAHSGQAAFFHCFLPGGNVAMILRISGADTADGGNAHAVEVGACFCRVALKIAVQCAVLLRDGKLVAGLGEMVHTNVEVPRVDELEQASAENL